MSLPPIADYDTDETTVEGDIILSPEQLTVFQNYRTPLDARRSERAVVKEEAAKWPLGIVPYEFSPNLSKHYN